MPNQAPLKNGMKARLGAVGPPFTDLPPAARWAIAEKRKERRNFLIQAWCWFSFAGVLLVWVGVIATKLLLKES